MLHVKVPWQFNCERFFSSSGAFLSDVLLPMKVLLTGHQGFVGSWMLQLVPGAVGLEKPDGFAVDLLDRFAVVEAVARINPDAVVHLAAQSAVPASFEDPQPTIETNLLGTQNLLLALKAHRFSGRLLFVSTAEVYGQSLIDFLPTNEQAPLMPLNPYAVSKVAAEALCLYWQRVEGLEIVVARPFNHIGPRQSPRFAIADFAKAIAEMKRGLLPNVLHVGDLDVTRDFTDVRDVIRAYQLLLERGLPGQVYNVCSGMERNLRQAVETIAKNAGIDVEIVVDPARLRKSGQRRACGNPDKLFAATGWVPAISWEQSLKDLFIDWEQQPA